MSFLVCFIFCLSMHACNARPLMQLLDKDFGATIQLSSKVGKVREVERFENQAVAKTTVMTERNLMASKVEDIRGSQVKLSYPLEHSQESPVTEGSNRLARSTLESPQNNANETIKSNENGAVEDVVVMDYAPPHRKPPIHNKQP